MNLKRIFIGLFLIIFTVSSLGISPDESFAGAHPDAKIKDGNATQKIGKGYDPTDVNPAIKNRYEKGIMKDFVSGGKHPEKKYNPNKGNRFGYDVYLGVTNSPTKKPLRIETHGGKDYLVFDGWSAIHGYYHHDRYNQATYIGVKNLKNNERKIYKAQMTNMDAYADLRYNFAGKNKMCPDSGRDAHLKYNNECNMEYKWVGFRAYLPLDDLFPKNGENNVWALEIIKGVKGHGYTPSNTIAGARYVYAPLVIPYDTKKLSWSKNHANVIVSSGTDLRWLTMSASGVIRRAVPRSNDRSEFGKHFNLGDSYLWRTQDEKAGVAVWHGVRSPHDNNKTRYNSSCRKGVEILSSARHKSGLERAEHKLFLALYKYRALSTVQVRKITGYGQRYVNDLS